MGDDKNSNHVAPKTKLYVPKDDSPMLLNFTGVPRQTKTSISPLHESTFDDYWHIDGDEPLSEPWIGVTRLALQNKNSLEGYMWVQGRPTKKQDATRTGNIRPKSFQRKAINKSAEESPIWTR